MPPKVELTPEVLAAVQRSMDAYCELEGDALAVAWWLDASFSAQIARLDVLKHAATDDDVISYVSLQLAEPSFSSPPHDMARTCFEALGWRLKPTYGPAHLITALPQSAHSSAHARLAAITRVQRALDYWNYRQGTDPDPQSVDDNPGEPSRASVRGTV